MGHKSRRVLLVHCHPDPDSLISAARTRALRGLEMAGHEVVELDLYESGFVPELCLEEWSEHATPELPRGVAGEHAAHLAWADTLVFTYPTWFGAQPAMLKGWLDRVFTTGVAYDIVAGKNHIRGRLGNIKRIVVITSHGSPKYVNALEGEPGKRVLLRGVRSLCGHRVRTSWLALYNVDADDPKARVAWLDKVEAKMAKI